MQRPPGAVICCLRNDRLALTVPHEFHGQARADGPDFVLRLRDGSQRLHEIMGVQQAELRAKHEAARRWEQAVNPRGQTGPLGFLA